MCGSIQIQSSRDKICLGWSKFNWQDASDISWLGMLTSWRSMPWQRFKLIRIQTLSRVSSLPLETFSPQQFSLFVTVAKLREGLYACTHLVALKNRSHINSIIHLFGGPAPQKLAIISDICVCLCFCICFSTSDCWRWCWLLQWLSIVRVQGEGEGSILKQSDLVNFCVVFVCVFVFVPISIGWEGGTLLKLDLVCFVFVFVWVYLCLCLSLSVFVFVCFLSLYLFQ